jgi:peptide deformylase
VIIDQSGEQDCHETCSSVRDISAPHPPQKVTVEALDASGQKLTLTPRTPSPLRLSHGLDHWTANSSSKRSSALTTSPLKANKSAGNKLKSN